MAHTEFEIGEYTCIAFTSSETWSVPADCKKVDVDGAGTGTKGLEVRMGFRKP